MVNILTEIAKQAFGGRAMPRPFQAPEHQLFRNTDARSIHFDTWSGSVYAVKLKAGQPHINETLVFRGRQGFIIRRGIVTYNAVPYYDHQPLWVGISEHHKCILIATQEKIVRISSPIVSYEVYG